MTCGYWHNDELRVRLIRDDEDHVRLLSVHRHDHAPIHSWPTLQWVKDLLAGEDVEAVEVYPRHDRIVDMANVYHLWCARPGVRLGFSLNPMDAINHLGVSMVELEDGFARLAEAMGRDSRNALSE